MLSLAQLSPSLFCLFLIFYILIVQLGVYCQAQLNLSTLFKACLYVLCPPPPPVLFYLCSLLMLFRWTPSLYEHLCVRPKDGAFSIPPLCVFSSLATLCVSPLTPFLLFSVPSVCFFFITTQFLSLSQIILPNGDLVVQGLSIEGLFLYTY